MSCTSFFFLEEKFQQLQHSFLEKHYLEFDDSDENKLSYTAIFNEYVSYWTACCFIMKLRLSLFSSLLLV